MSNYVLAKFSVKLLKFTEDFESEAGATDIPFKGESSVEDEEPLVRKLPRISNKKKQGN